jgi:hypothetical protein
MQVRPESAYTEFVVLPHLTNVSGGISLDEFGC